MSVGVVNKQTGDRIPTAGMPAIDSVLSGSSTNPVQNAVITAALAGKQDILTFDDTPTDNSNNPVKSNGIYDALALKANASDVTTALATKADLADLAPAFSDSTAYTVGQYVSYDGNIYKCTSAHSAGAWAAGDFTLVAIGNELNTLNSNLSSLGLSVVNGGLCQTYSV